TIGMEIDPRHMARWPANDRSGTWRSSARDAPGVGRALKRLGARIRALRLECGLTQELAAEGAEVDEKHWEGSEGARANPTAAGLVGIARPLDVPLAGLFEPGDDKEQPRPPSSPRRARSRRVGASPTPARSRTRPTGRPARARG